MDYSIFIEGQRADAPDGFSSQFTYSIDDIRDFSARKTAVSKTIILPASARNRAIFGHIYNPTSGNRTDAAQANINYNFDASRTARAVVLLNGLQIFKGSLSLLEIVVDEQGNEGSYECYVVGELGGLVAALGESKLETLDFSAYNHTFSHTNIINSFATPLGSGYYYPLVDYGYSTDKVNFPIENFRPTLHIKEYIDKIFTAAGFTYESAFLNTDYFKKLILPYNGAFLYKEVAKALSLQDVSHTFHESSNNAMQWDSRNTPFDIFETSDFTRFYWRRSEPTKMTLQFSTAWTRSNSDAVTIEVGLEIGQEATGGAVTWLEGKSIYKQQVTGTSGTVSAEVVVDIPANCFIQVRTWKGGTINMTFSGSVLELVGDPLIKVPVAFGDLLEAKSFIPKDVLRVDFLASVIKLFNLMIYEDAGKSNHLVIEPWVNFYDTDTANVINWDGKLDRSKPYRLKVMGELTSRVYEAKYKQDSDYYNDLYKQKYGEVYGTYTHDTGATNAQAKTSIDVIFSPTPLVGYAGTVKVMPAIFKKDASGKVERVAHNPRIWFRSPDAIYMGGSESFTITKGGVVQATLMSYPYAGHLDDPDAPANDLNYGAPRELYFALATGALQNNLFNQFWSFYIGEISDKDSKLLTGNFLLTPADISRLDFTKIIFINGSLWRLNKIEDYSTNQPEPVKCELLKVIDLV